MLLGFVVHQVESLDHPELLALHHLHGETEDGCRIAERHLSQQELATGEMECGQRLGLPERFPMFCRRGQ